MLNRKNEKRYVANFNVEFYAMTDIEAKALTLAIKNAIEDAGVCDARADKLYRIFDWVEKKEVDLSTDNELVEGIVGSETRLDRVYGEYEDNEEEWFKDAVENYFSKNNLAKYIAEYIATRYDGERDNMTYGLVADINEKYTGCEIEVEADFDENGNCIRTLTIVKDSYYGLEVEFDMYESCGRIFGKELVPHEMINEYKMQLKNAA